MNNRALKNWHGGKKFSGALMNEASHEIDERDVELANRILKAIDEAGGIFAMGRILRALYLVTHMATGRFAKEPAVQAEIVERAAAMLLTMAQVDRVRRHAGVETEVERAEALRHRPASGWVN